LTAQPKAVRVEPILTLATDITFGPFTIDPASSRLFRDGVEVRLRPQAFHALVVLVKHRGRAVSYEQMIAEAWKGTFVSRHTVDVTVGEIRKTLGEYGSWLTHRPKVGYTLDVPTSDALVRKGWHFWDRRTRQGFERALETFRQAAAECPSDFRAFEGLSASYLMLATWSIRPPREMFPLFLEAHNRAVALGALTPSLRCNRGHAMHMFERRYDEAESELLQAIKEKPNLASVYVRLSMLYSTLGRLDDALDIVRRGYEVDPLWPLLPVMETAVRFWRREYAEAIDRGAKLVELHPYLQVGRVFYAQALEFSGRLEEALAQYRLASLMSPDTSWLLALEGTCLAKMRRTRDATATLDELEQMRSTEYVDAYFLAVLRAALDQPGAALAELERAVDESSTWLWSFPVDPKLDCFRGHPRFAQLSAALQVPSPSFQS
jgi:DNA-binding winged helix-turn-helix (wHTH) protein/Flp pilus assembly protein TadD